MRVLLYIRVSKIGDRHDTLISDDVQEDVCRKWASREGLVVVGEPVTDLDKTGREMTKRQISHSIERVRRGEADGIVVWKVSRWGRNLIDSMLNVNELQEAGGFIASATENLDDVETPMGRFSLTQMLAIAQLQSDQIGETWENIHDYRRQRGLPHNGGPRFGYIKNGDVGRDDHPSLVYTIDPHTGPWLRRCYENFVAGKGVSKLVLDLNENGITTTRGGRFTYRTLLKILDSGFGAGLVIDRRGANPNTDKPSLVNYYPGAQEPVIDTETWDAYVERRARKAPPREVSAPTKLSGHLYCASCQRKLRVYWSTKSGRNSRHRGYECGRDKYSNQTTILCPSPVAIRQSMAEASVLEWLERNARGEDDFAAALERQHQREQALADAEAIDSEVVRLKSRRKRLLDVFLDADGDAEDLKAEFRDKRDEITAQIEGLTARAQFLRSENSVAKVPSIEAFEGLVAIWPDADVNMMNEALRSVVKRIYVHRAGEQKAGLVGRLEVIGLWADDPYQTSESQVGAMGAPSSASISDADRRS
ncbi:recombinase family protein [Promicromonospora aerolata]|uniref:Recombinase family protein n=1 Tax=Promicromonospora aerolata TaxID=195749 RepID=A0ABW4V306_9MICO